MEKLSCTFVSRRDQKRPSAGAFCLQQKAQRAALRVAGQAKGKYVERSRACKKKGTGTMTDNIEYGHKPEPLGRGHHATPNTKLSCSQHSSYKTVE